MSIAGRSVEAWKNARSSWTCTNLPQSVGGPPHPRHEFGPGNPGGVVRAGLLLRVAAAFRAVTVTPVPACHGIALLANVPDRRRRDGQMERVIRREDTVISMPLPHVMAAASLRRS
jgi:hypothetical protein